MTNIKLTASIFLFTLLLPIHCQATEPSNAVISKQVPQVAKKYAQSISCDYQIKSSNLVSLKSINFSTQEYSNPEYVVIWSGDIGCNGGSHSIRYLLTTLNIRAANTITVDPSLSSPAIKFPIVAKSINKITRLSNNSLKLITFDHSASDCCSENLVETIIKRDTKGNWKIISE